MPTTVSHHAPPTRHNLHDLSSASYYDKVRMKTSSAILIALMALLFALIVAIGYDYANVRIGPGMHLAPPGRSSPKPRPRSKDDDANVLLESGVY